MMQKGNSLKFLLLFSGLISLLAFAIGAFIDSDEATVGYAIFLYVVFFITYLKFSKKYGFLNIFSLQLFVIFTFALGGPFFSIFLGTYNFKIYDTSVWGDFRYSNMTVQKVFLLYTIYICFSSLAYMKLKEKQKANEIDFIAKRSGCKMFETVGKVLMYSTFPFAIYYAIQMFILGFMNRALLLGGGGTEALGMPFYLRTLHLLFEVGYFCIVASSPEKKTFIRMTILFFIPMVPTTLMGERGDVVVFFLFVLWYLYRAYNYKIKAVYLVVAGFGIMIMSLVLVFFRNGMDVEPVSFLKIIPDFFREQNSGFNVVAIYIENINKIKSGNYPFIFDAAIGAFTGVSGQSYEALSVRSGLTHYLAYFCNQDYYFRGNSMGTATVAEFYEFGALGVMVGALILGFMCYITDKANTSYKRYYVYYLFTYLLMSPRNALLPELYQLLKYSLILLVVITIYSIIHPKKNTKRIKDVSNKPAVI